MVRRSFSREYKLEAVKLIQDREVTVVLLRGSAPLYKGQLKNK
ncbi:uncharacterized protein NMK_2318 [Novimethylophilus kurashikiensis]|uniref:Transposase n=1 Tax=Novimethylophilus kurashikiensis TaxID=1825523 RepID=A0A2R5F944_9PROT|nr:uncharacterized protein NMK_2318 [Novimethylophilus kurashikiensis]